MIYHSSVSHWNDLITKSEKAFAADGPAFLNVISMCHRGWRFPPQDTVHVSKLAVETCFWPLYEIVNGKLKITYKPKNKLPVSDWTKLQGRFKHLQKAENAHIVEEIQKEVDEDWEALLRRESFDQGESK